MFSPKIKLVDEKEKFEKVKLVKPHISFNRADIKFQKNFELLEIKYKSQIRYIAFHIELNYCYLSVYMMDIDKKVFDKIIDFIFKKFKVRRFYILQSLNGNKQVNKTIHSLLELPNTQEEFDNRFSSKTRYNRKKERRLLEQNYNCHFGHYKKGEITEEMFERFLELKRVGYEKAYSNITPKDMFSDFFHITDVYTIEIDNKIEAFCIYSIIDKEEIYFVNVTYNYDYAKYGLGVMLYYHSIENLIKRGIKRVYLGGGHYEYKANSHAIVTNTFEGYFNYIPLSEKLFSIQIEIKNGREQKSLYLLGLKFLIRKNQINTDDYKKYYEKIKLEKKLKKYAEDNKGKKIVIYGVGQMFKVLFENYDLSNLDIVGICDKCFKNKKDGILYGYPCISPEDLKNINFDNICVMVLRYADVVNYLKNDYPNKTIQVLLK